MKVTKLSCSSLLLIVLSCAAFQFALAGGKKRSSVAESMKWLEEKTKNEDVIVLPSGLWYSVIRSGTTGQKHPHSDTPCNCRYAGVSMRGEPFDRSSVNPDVPQITQRLIPDQSIKGIKEALLLMVEGDKWKLYLTPALGYGDVGFPPTVGPGEAVVYELELVKIVFDCDPVSLESCSKAEKMFVEKAKEDYGSDPDFIETGIQELEEVRKKLSTVESKALLDRKTDILTALLRMAEAQDEL